METAAAESTTNSKTRRQTMNARGAAEQAISDFRKTLVPGINTLVGPMAITHLGILVKLHDKTVEKKRIESEAEYIPRSARVSFRYQPIKGVDSVPAFNELVTNTNTMIDGYRVALRGQVLELVKEEEKFLRNQAIDHFCKSTAKTIAAILDGHDIKKSDALIGAITRITFEAHYNDLCKSAFPNVSHSDFRTNFQTATGIRLPQIGQITSDAVQGRKYTMSFFLRDLAPDSTDTAPLVEVVKTSLIQLFVLPFLKFVAQDKRNRIASNLKKLAAETIDMEATEEAAALADSSLPTDQATMSDEIKRQAKILASELFSELKKKEAYSNSQSKNVTPGGPRKQKVARAPVIKKKTAAKKQQQPKTKLGANKKKHGDNQAAVRNKGSDKNSKEKKNRSASKTAKRKMKG
jgi:pyruvate/2-oxoglutarate dehydrogenase complex dihydrolipoamide acyltransferase (E2) component